MTVTGRTGRGRSRAWAHPPEDHGPAALGADRLGRAPAGAAPARISERAVPPVEIRRLSGDRPRPAIDLVPDQRQVRAVRLGDIRLGTQQETDDVAIACDAGRIDGIAAGLILARRLP